MQIAVGKVSCCANLLARIEFCHSYVLLIENCSVVISREARCNFSGHVLKFPWSCGKLFYASTRNAEFPSFCSRRGVGVWCFRSLNFASNGKQNLG